MEIARATHEDYLEIMLDLPDFWSTSGPADRTRAYHYPFLVHEFGDTAFVIHIDDKVAAYLFGFIATAEPVGYIHLVGVRAPYQRQGLGRSLYAHFTDVARQRGCDRLRSVTAPFNTDSQAFHAALGFEQTGTRRDAEGVLVHPDYHGPGKDVIIFSKRIGEETRR